MHVCTTLTLVCLKIKCFCFSFPNKLSYPFPFLCVAIESRKIKWSVVCISKEQFFSSPMLISCSPPWQLLSQSPLRAMPGQGPESWGAKEPLFFFCLSFSLTTHSIALKMQSWVVSFLRILFPPTMHMVPSYTLGSGASILPEEGETQENKKPIYFYRLKTIYREMTTIQSIIRFFFY